MREQAIAIFQAAVQSVQPQYLLPQHIRLQKDGLQLGDQFFSFDNFQHIYVIGAGKAAAAMAREVEIILGDRITEGIVVTKYDHSLPLQVIRCIEAGHPLPDAAGIKAGEEITALLKKAGEDDIVIALISGGASALLVDCPPGASLAEVQQVFGQLLASGATIQEMNVVRKHLSPGIKGGLLVRTAWPAAIVSFVLSDVPGDNLDSIASGPTVADPSTFRDARYILEKYNLFYSLPDAVLKWMQDGLDGIIPDTPKPGDILFGKSNTWLIGTNRIALQAARVMAEKSGFHVTLLTDSLSGEARLKAIELVDTALNYSGPRPACLLCGGETTVTIEGNGLGGRNQEFALAALNALKNNDVESTHMPVILSAGTDGTDGPTPAAGAVIDRNTLTVIREKKLRPEQYLAQNDSYNFFLEAGGHIITGATQTNVMDVVIVLIK